LVGHSDQFAPWNTVSQSLDIQSLFVPISEKCALLSSFSPAETTCNYGLHGYYGKNKWLSVVALLSSSQQHRNTHILCSHKHVCIHTEKSQNVFSNNCYKTDMLIDTAGAALPNTNRPALMQSPISSHGGVTPRPRERERDCMDALMFMFGRLAMMKECLFKSGLEGPLFNATRTPPLSDTRTLVRPSIVTHTHAHRDVSFHHQSLHIVQPPYVHHICNSVQKHCLQIHAWHWFSGFSGSRILVALYVEAALTLQPHLPCSLSSSPSSPNSNERASLFYSVCVWSVSHFSHFTPLGLLLQPYAWPSLVFLHLISLLCCGL